MKGVQIPGLTKEVLEELYVNNEEATLESVAELLGCNSETVRKWIKKFGLATKARSRSGRVRGHHDQRLANPDWVRSELETKTAKQVAQELNCGTGVVTYWAHKHGILDKDKSKNIKDALARKYPNGRKGEQASNWRGGKHRHGAGYIKVYHPDHPEAHGGSVFEHRLVMESIVGRPLEQGEIVHHLDGNKANNAPENLQLVKRGEHISNHFKASHEVLELRQRVAELEAENAALRAQLEGR